MRDKIKIILFLLLVGYSCPAQTASEQQDAKIPVRLLIEDLQLLQKKLDSTQPGLYLYTPKDSLSKIFNAIRDSIVAPLTAFEFFRRIAPLNIYIRNLHTNIWPSKAYENETSTTYPRFPLDIYWLDGKMYVLRNHTSENISAGAEVTSINGRSATDIFQTILQCRVRDGYNETYPIAQANRGFASYYSQLIGTPKVFVTELKMADGSLQRFELAGKSSSEIEESRTLKYHRKYSQHAEDWMAWFKDKQPALLFEIKDKTAVLTLRTFHIYTMEALGQNYETFLKDAFDKLAESKVTDLVIDLRNSQGGHDLVGMALMSHLHDSTFFYYRKRTTFIKPIGKSVKKGNVYEIIGRKGWIGKVTPAQQIYRRNVYVLMNGYSVSATGEFIGHLKNINRAIFIGEEAGGNPVIFTGGQNLRLELPHTHIIVNIPLSLNDMNVRLKNTGHGVIPDHHISPSIDDILNERDVEMAFVLNLISQSAK